MTFDVFTTDNIHSQVIDEICGVDSANVNQTQLPTILQYTPAGSCVFPRQALPTYVSLKQRVCVLDDSRCNGVALVAKKP